MTGVQTCALPISQGFDHTIWAQDKQINDGYPYLISNPPPDSDAPDSPPIVRHRVVGAKGTVYYILRPE